MIRRIPVAAILLAAICVLLTVALYREITAPAEHFASAPLAPAAHAAATASVGVVAPLRQQFAETDRRPLFVASRRPSAGATKPGAAPSVSALPPPALLTLVGIILSPEERFALIKSANLPEVQKVAEGATIDGWQIRRIFADHIVVAANAQEQSVAFPLQRENGAPSAVGQPGTPFPPSAVVRPAQRP